MDYGKMLAEVLASANVGRVDYARGIDGHFDLDAAAEAFLAKVREAENAGVDTRRRHELDGADRY